MNAARRGGPVLVLLTASTGWAWRVHDQLRDYGLDTVTVDVHGHPDAAAIGRRPDYSLRRSRLPVTPALRRIAKAHGAHLGACIYGGRHAVELALLKRTLPGFRFVAFLVGSDILRPHDDGSLRSRAARQVVRASLASADLVLTNGEHLADAVRQLVGDNAAVATWRNGTDVPGEVPLRGAATATGLTIVAPRPWDELYNNRQALAGVVAYSGRHPGEPLRALFCGPRAAPADLAALDAARRDLGPGHVLAATDGYEFAQRFDLFGDHAVTLSTSRSDGTANCVLEAMVAGSLPVLSDIAANRLLVTEYGIYAELAALDSPAAVRLALERVRERSGEWPALAASNRAIVEERLSVPAVQQRLNGLIDRLVAV